ncbi:MAG: efflux transporter outer membrane subunit [Proteobacteria bacterium]|nr:efflux transporter outer membrane subunit [Pseudomonadota bacterium]
MSNPLLDFSGDIPFDRITPADVAPAVDQLLGRAGAALASVTANDFPASWDAIARVLDVATEELGRAWGAVSHLNSVADTPELRAAYNAALPRVTEFWTRLGADEHLYAKYKAIDPATLNAEQRQARANAMRNFVLSGAELQGTAKERFAAIQERQAELQQKFSENALDATDAYAYYASDEEIAGLPADVAQAEAQYKSTQAQLLEAGSQRAQLEHALAALLGLAPAAFDLQATGLLPAPPQVPAELPSQLLQRRPDIAAAERRVAAANAQVGVAQAAYFPALTLSGSAGYRGTQLAGLIAAPHLFWSVGPALALTLFDGGARGAAVESARAAMDLAAATYRQTVITALQEVEDNLVAATVLEQEQQVQTEALAAAQKALAVITNQYKAGTVAYLNVLTAQTTVLNARGSLLNVKNRRLVAVNTLLKNVAGGWDIATQ